ncbi:MAG: glycogen/starch/alpha-glucan phosphorylase [Myxococcota bacterium]
MSSELADDPSKPVRIQDDRTAMNPKALQRAMLDHLYYTIAKDIPSANFLDVYRACALVARDRLVQRWMRTLRTYYEQDVKRVYYLSAEYLPGRFLGKNLSNLGIFDTAAELLAEFDIDLDEVLAQENDPGLGNGGLGRLAACFLDSMATLGLPGYGYGIRYEFGIFEQEIRDGWQVEHPDAWLKHGNPWEFPRHEYTVEVNFYGHVEETVDAHGDLQVHWTDTRKVLGVPYDTPIAGYGNDTVNTLRLWAARASKELDFAVFNDGDYRRAVEEKAISESISKVLYPNDESREGRELRLKQQYFFVCCSIHDIIRRYKKTHDSFDTFSDAAAIQLNDTHPAIAVAELMRVLVDREGVPWEKAWEQTTQTFGYTNHTLLAEALEKWPVSMFERLLPRHLKIIYEINRRFMKRVHVHAPHDDEIKAKMSIIEDGDDPMIRMANLAVVGSHSVNGVAALHSKLIQEQLLPNFADMWPEKFNNKTNGVTPRRWLHMCNRRLSEAITSRIGDDWVSDLSQLEQLMEFADDSDFLAELRDIKRQNKQRLIEHVEEHNNVQLDPDSIFDVQVKRLHQYKRQLLNCLHIIALYAQVKDDPDTDIVPRTFIFGGKAAPGYVMAKLHIKLINDVADIVNHDPCVRDRIKVVFLENYNVSLAEKIIPAADISEQISMAGKEASGTGNMKFAMNGALTVGTLDGANIEIREQVGEENFFRFGMTADEVQQLKSEGYNPREYIADSPLLSQAIEMIASGFFSPDEPDRFMPVVEELAQRDTYMLCADFEDYVRAQREAAEVYRDQDDWSRRALHNIAHTGTFSSDRTIREYARDIWGVEPVEIELHTEDEQT